MKTRLQRKIDPYWHPYPACSGALHRWLIDGDSLTRRLQASCRHFAVRHVRQSWSKPLPDEAALLGLRPGAAAWVREVWLQDGDKPLVFARSILPRNSLRGAWRKLGSLGCRPLGEALFADARVIRRPLAYRKLRLGHPILKNARQTKVLWARRSVFVRAGHALLVTEAFLPVVLTL